MASPNAATMDALQINEFLARQRFGVLSLARENDAHGVPVSFAYDEGEPAVYVRFGFGDDDRMRRYLESAELVSFVVHDETDGGWLSVQIEGRLEERSKTALDSAILEVVDDLRIPFFHLGHRPARDVEFRVVRLSIATMRGVAFPTGRRRVTG